MTMEQKGHREIKLDGTAPLDIRVTQDGKPVFALVAPYVLIGMAREPDEFGNPRATTFTGGTGTVADMMYTLLALLDVLRQTDEEAWLALLAEVINQIARSRTGPNTGEVQ